MSPNVFWIIIFLITATVMLFQLRTLMQSSNANYYNSLVQWVVKLTDPLVNIRWWNRLSLGSWNLAGFAVALVISLVGWLVVSFIFLPIPFVYTLIGGIFLFIKSLGYLIIGLLLAQALCSWLPATREWSFLFSQITEPLTAPVQRFVPPIGMIDISLMLILIGIYLLNGLVYKILGALSRDLVILWSVV